MKRSIQLILAAATVAVGIAPMTAIAAYPERPVTVIIPYKPGGSTDTTLRLIAQVLEKELGQKILLKNTSGAAGATGMAEAFRSKPDGYTLGTYNTNTEIVQATGNAEFDSEDMVPVALFGDGYLTVTAKGDGPYMNLADVKKAALAKPNTVSVAMGRGTLAQFGAVLLAERLGAPLKIVNVGNGAKKKAAVLGGHEDTLLEPAASLVDLHNAKKLRILAIFAPNRVDFLPNVPTAKEQGVDLVASQVLGLFAPKGTPADRVKVIADAVSKVPEHKEIYARLMKFGLVWNFKAGDDFRAFMRENKKMMFSVKEKAGF